MKRNISMMMVSVLMMFSDCNKQTDVPALVPFGSLSFYNAAASFNSTSSRLLLTNSNGHMDTLRAMYNQQASGEDNPFVEYPVGASAFAKYYAMTPGTYRTAFMDTALGSLLNTGVVKLGRDLHQTVYLADSLGYFTTVVTEDDTQRTPDSATIRLLNLCPDAGPVRLFLDSTVVKGMEHVGYGQCTGFVRVPTTIKSGIRATTAEPSEKTLSRKSFPLEGGRVYTLIVRGYVDPPGGERTRIVSLSAIINF